MRRIVLFALVAAIMAVGMQGLVVAGMLQGGLGDLASVPLAFAIQDKPTLDVDVELKEESPAGTTLAVNPVWLALGGLAVIVLIVLIAMAMRGGSSTVVKAD
jgi:hypothetical protein